jgi:hypothetical protein
LTFNVKVVAPEDGMICDFCSSSNVYKSYACEDFVHDVLSAVEVCSEGIWVACEECAKLIDADQWDELLSRAVRSMVKELGVTQLEATMLRERIGLIHQQFRSLRKMEA